VEWSLTSFVVVAFLACEGCACRPSATLRGQFTGHTGSREWTVTPTHCSTDGYGFLLDFVDAQGQVVRVAARSTKAPFVRVATGDTETVFRPEECRIESYSMIDWYFRVGKHSSEKTYATGAHVECHSDEGSIAGTVLARGCL
jgi:hypothetical protein